MNYKYFKGFLPVSIQKRLPEIIKQHIIKVTVMRHLNVSPPVLHSKSRKEETVFAKHMYGCLLRRFTYMSTTQIGHRLNMNHSSVIHALKKAENTYDILFFTHYQILEDEIVNHLAFING